jgi:hypothetical protein
VKSRVEEEINSINRELKRNKIIGAPGILLIGLAVHGIFAEPGRALHPFLNDIGNCYFMLAVGGAIAVWEVKEILRLTKRQSELNKMLGT